MTNFEAKCLSAMTMMCYETVGKYPKAYAAVAGVGGALGSTAITHAADIFATLTDAGQELYGKLTVLAVVVGLVALVAAGIIYIIPFGEQSWIRGAKNWIVRILVGIAIVSCAASLLSFIMNNFGASNSMTNQLNTVTGQTAQ